MSWTVKAAAATAFRGRVMRHRMLSVSMEDGPLLGRGISGMMLLILASKAVSECQFPVEWHGEWFEGGSGGITISATNISRKGICIEAEHESYLLHNSELDCGLCLVIEERHSNVLQYKESFCVGMDTLHNICSTIHGQTLHRTLFREVGYASACPFHDAYHFVYSNNSGGFCRNPVSYVRPCASRSLLRFHFQHCSDAAYTYNKVLDVECWGVWRDGSKMLLVGRLNSKDPEKNPKDPEKNPKDPEKQSNAGEDSYRCFMFRVQGSVVHLSMSADASCRGLISPTNGPVVIELTTDTFGWPKAQCTYPAFVTRNVWRDLTGNHVYRSNNMGDVVEKVRSSLSTYNATPLLQQNILEIWFCHSLLAKNLSADQFIAVTFVVRGCFSSYRCIRFVKKVDGVVELAQGKDSGSAFIDQCLSQATFTGDRRLLLTGGITGRSCPMEGRFLIHTGSSVCSSYFRSGCNGNNVIDIASNCSSKSGLQLECLRKWRDDKLRYLVARSAGDVDGIINCFTFRRKGENLLFSTDVACNGEAPTLLRDGITYALDRQPLKCDAQRALPTNTDVVHDSLQDVDDNDEDVASSKDVYHSTGHVDDSRRSRDYRTSPAANNNIRSIQRTPAIWTFILTISLYWQ